MRRNVSSTRNIGASTPGADPQGNARNNGVGRDTDSSEKTTPDRIRARAYELFQGRAGAFGDAVSDWLNAERELGGNLPDRPEP
jgi:Protein of unknown function (DUF2934)